MNKNGLKVEKAALRGSLLFYDIGNSSGRDVHCGVRGRCRDAAAEGASFANETLF